MSAITTHVLDTGLGRPAAGVHVRLERVDASGTDLVAEAVTDADGRCAGLGPEQVDAGTYRLTFGVERYADHSGQECFFPEVSITFRLNDPTAHHHVPLLLSPFAYSTYRGS